jgi:hypothetical protein
MQTNSVCDPKPSTAVVPLASGRRSGRAIASDASSRMDLRIECTCQAEASCSRERASSSGAQKPNLASHVSAGDSGKVVTMPSAHAKKCRSIRTVLISPMRLSDC